MSSNKGLSSRMNSSYNSTTLRKLFEVDPTALSKEILYEQRRQERALEYRLGSPLCGLIKVKYPSVSSSDVPHTTFKGIDVPLNYNFSTDLQVAPVDGYCTGSYEVLVLHGSNYFSVLKPPNRFSLPEKGPQTYIRSSCLRGFEQCCNGSIIAVKRKLSKKNWSPLALGVVESLNYFTGISRSVHKITFFESNGPISSNGAPTIVFGQDWNEMKKYTEKYTLPLEDVEFFFINLVSIQNTCILSKPKIISKNCCYMYPGSWSGTSRHRHL